MSLNLPDLELYGFSGVLSALELYRSQFEAQQIEPSPRNIEMLQTDLNDLETLIESIKNNTIIDAIDTLTKQISNEHLQMTAGRGNYVGKGGIKLILNDIENLLGEDGSREISEDAKKLMASIILLRLELNSTIKDLTVKELPLEPISIDILTSEFLYNGVVIGRKHQTNDTTELRIDVTQENDPNRKFSRRFIKVSLVVDSSDLTDPKYKVRIDNISAENVFSVKGNLIAPDRHGKLTMDADEKTISIQVGNREFILKINRIPEVQFKQPERYQITFGEKVMMEA